MTSRHHHYLSQCYIKGFTKGNAKKSKLSVIDFSTRKNFETTPRNVGGIRDFNRIEIEGYEPDALENAWSEFEGSAATAIKQLKETDVFDGDTRENILALIGLLAVRSPEQRENWRQTHEKLTDSMMELALASKERWEEQVQKMKDDGVEVNDDVTYEDLKDFQNRKEYKLQLPREYHIHMEMVGLEAIFPLLQERMWLVVKAGQETGPFITSDNPVSLTWNDIDSVPPIYRNSPGFGLKETQIYFPVSKDIALIGEFNGREGSIDATPELVAALNSRVLMCVYKQLYSPTLKFYFMGKDGEILNGNCVLQELQA